MIRCDTEHPGWRRERIRAGLWLDRSNNVLYNDASIFKDSHLHYA